MEVDHESNIVAAPVADPQALGAAMKVLVSPDQGWTDHVMRIIELAPDGYSPHHTHPWPHINYVISGQGVVHIDGQETPVKGGSYAFVPAGARHQYRSTGQGAFRFICIVPREGHPPPYERSRAGSGQ